MASDDKASGNQVAAEPGRDFIRDIVKADHDAGRYARSSPFSTRAERLSPYRPRQGDLPEFRHCRGIRRTL